MYAILSSFPSFTCAVFLGRRRRSDSYSPVLEWNALPRCTEVISRPQIHWSKAMTSLVTLVNNAASLKSLLTLSILQLWGSKTDYFDKYSSVAQLTTPTTTCIHRSSLTGLCAFIHRSSLTGLCAFIPFTAACHHTLLVSYVHVTVIPAITALQAYETKEGENQNIRNYLPSRRIPNYQLSTLDNFHDNTIAFGARPRHTH